MAITLTKYIYPLKEKIALSESFGFYIDNPRTDEEIKFINDYIKPALMRNHESHKPNYNPMLAAAFGIANWRDYMKGKDDYVHDFFKKNYEASVEDIIGQSWVILRYRDNGEFENAMKDKNVFFDIFFTDARHAYWEKYNTLQSYSQIISLLCHDDGDRYLGDSFILLKKPQDIFYPLDHTHEIIESFTAFNGNSSIANDNRGKTWNFFPDVKDALLAASRSVEKILSQEERSIKKKQSAKEKLLFVGDLLRVIENETQDVKVKLLLLVSVIEFMVTRNPDSNRFNIEDSIIKQFALKTSIIIYNNQAEVDLNEIKKNLKLIYNQRSDVAHGNYISPSDNEKIVESFYLLFNYIKAIIVEYIKDSKFIDFIKEN